MATSSRRNAKQEKHAREFQAFLDIRNQAWDPVWDGGRVLYEEAQAARLQGDHLGVAARFRKILDLQATARATFAELIKGNPNTDPSGACCRHFEEEYEAFVAAIEHQLAHPLTATECQGFLDVLEPKDRLTKEKKVAAFHVAGGCTGYSNTVDLVYTTPYDDWMDDAGYRWGKDPWSIRDLYFSLAPPDARGHGYFLTPWGAQVAAQLLEDDPDLLTVDLPAPEKPKPARRAPRTPRKVLRPRFTTPVWIRNARGHIVAGGVPLFPDFLEAK